MPQVLSRRARPSPFHLQLQSQRPWQGPGSTEPPGEIERQAAQEGVGVCPARACAVVVAPEANAPVALCPHRAARLQRDHLLASRVAAVGCVPQSRYGGAEVIAKVAATATTGATTAAAAAAAAATATTTTTGSSSRERAPRPEPLSPPL